MKDEPLKWNPKRHDALVAAVTTEEAKAKAMKIFSAVYDGWKKRFRKKEGMSTEQVKDALLDLRNEVSKRLTAAGCGDWVKFSLELIDEKLGLVDTVLIKGTNKITQYVPSIQHGNIPAEQAEFRTQEELQAIPWVKSVVEKEGFMGFVLVGPVLHAGFEDEEMVPVGVCASGIGLERIPSIQDLKKALAKSLAADAAKSAGEPGGSGPSAPDPAA